MATLHGSVTVRELPGFLFTRLNAICIVLQKQPEKFIEISEGGKKQSVQQGRTTLPGHQEPYLDFFALLKSFEQF
jgi:hypothetical protein